MAKIRNFKHHRHRGFYRKLESWFVKKEYISGWSIHVFIFCAGLMDISFRKLILIKEFCSINTKNLFMKRKTFILLCMKKEIVIKSLGKRKVICSLIKWKSYFHFRSMKMKKVIYRQSTSGNEKVFPSSMKSLGKVYGKSLGKVYGKSLGKVYGKSLGKV